MTKEEEYHQVTCPNCGAPLQPTGGTVECSYCGTVVERIAPPAPPPQEPAQYVIDVSAGPIAARRSCARSVVVVAAALVVLIGGLVAWLVVARSEVGPAQGPGPALDSVDWGRRSISGPALPVPVDRAGSADVLMFTYHYGSDENFYTLAYMDGLDHSLRWDSPPLKESGANRQVVIGPTLIYLADEDTLLALQRADGTLAWQATLADSVQFNLCPNCLQLVGRSLVVLSQDGTLQSFEAETGKALWSKRLNETPRSLWTVGQQVAVLDEEEDVRPGVSLFLLDPSTGELVRKITPGGPGPFGLGGLFSVYDGSVLISPSGDTIYAFYQLHPACAQRWDAATGEQAWLLSSEDDYFDRFTTPPMFIGNAIYASYDGYVLSVDPATGELRHLADEEDYELTLQDGRDGVLLVLAERQRGSRRYELWGLDAASGERMWERIFRDEAPLGESGSEGFFAQRITSRGLVLIQLLEDPRRIVWELIDLQSGESSGQVSTEIGDDTWSWREISWTDNTAWLTSTSLYAVDVLTGKLLYRVP